MPQDRRSALRSIGLSVAAVTVPGAAQARGRGRREGEEPDDGEVVPVKVKEIQQIQTDGSIEVTAVAVSHSNGEGKGEVDYFLIKHNTQTDSFSHIEISRKQYKAKTSGTGIRTQSAIQTQDVNVDGVERVHTGTEELDEQCDKWDDYTHKQYNTSVEFKQKVNDIGITTAAAYLARVISKGWGGGLIVAGAGLALVSGTDTISRADVDMDESLFGQTEAFYQTHYARGWKEYDTDDMMEFTDAPSHLEKTL